MQLFSNEFITKGKRVKFTLTFQRWLAEARLLIENMGIEQERHMLPRTVDSIFWVARARVRAHNTLWRDQCYHNSANESKNFE